MRIEDMKTVVVMMFDEGHPMSEICERLDLTEGFVRKTIIEWWHLVGERQREEEERWDGGW